MFALVPIGSKASNRTEPDQKMRVLFIGNSYTYFNNLPEMFSKLVASTGTAIETEMVARGGATLQQHWEEGVALKTLKQGHWDYVVLQEQSLLPINDPATMYKYAKMFDAEIKQVGAKTVFYLTWARQNRPETQAALTEAYMKISKELGAMVASAGIAWQSAIKENPQLVLHLPDQSHPNSAGSYLTACVFYSLLFSKSPENLPGRVEGRSAKTDGRINEESSELVNLSKTDALFLQRIAWQTVKGSNKEARSKGM
jgi:hypothetical protein